MEDDQKSVRKTKLHDVDDWHGFGIEDFEKVAESLSKQVEVIHQQFSTVKTLLGASLKRGIINCFTHTDDPKKLADAFDILRKNFSSCIEQIESMQKAIGDWRIAERGSRLLRFEAAAEERGWKIVGSWPEPVVSGIVFVVIDEARERATVNGSAVGGYPTAEKLILRVEAELRELEKNKTEADEFIGELWKAYQLSGGKMNEGVLVFDLLHALMLQRQSKGFLRNPTAALFRPYPVAQFRADLTGYLAAGSPPFDAGAEKYFLDIVGGSYAEHGLFMYFPQSYRLATCGRLTFRLGE